MIDRIVTARYRLPLEAVGDAGHGVIDSEELITASVYEDGLIGTGYAYTIGRGGRAIQAVIEADLTPLLVGQDATQIESLWRMMWSRLRYVGRGGIVSFAIAAVDIALWDLRGQREGKPLCALLGGASHEIPAYGSGVDLPKSLPDLLRQTEGFLERGFPGVKVKVGRPDPDEDLARVLAVRALIGDSVDLMIDANMSWDVPDAISRGEQLKSSRPFWLEEPTAPENVAGHRRIGDALGVPIAAGESLHSPEEFQSYVDERAIQIVQIDPVTNGGITASIRALRMADEAGLATSSHYTDELSAHLLCASRKPIYLEKHAFALDAYLLEPQRVIGGKVRPTEVPGNGIHFDEAALARFRT